MGDIFSFRRLRWGSPSGLSSPHFLRKRSSRFGGVGRYIGFVAIAVVAGAAWLASDQWYGGVPTNLSEPAVAAPIVTVVDGDTLRVGGETIRLVGLDTPETGRNAKCEGERTRGEAATRRMRELVASGGLDVKRVACACKPGTEGTSACNHGRLCGELKAHGRDVARILIAEGLAHEYVCGTTGWRRSWCG
ncbi:MAG: thermonuclease family protein [Xanthobacteraceae bacterium]